MNKRNISTLIMFVLTFSAATTYAQVSSAGVGLMYGSEIEQLGVRGDVVYQINDDFRAVADLGIFFPEKNDFGGGVESKVTWWEINANGNYLYYRDDTRGFMAYALAGLNFATVKVSFEGTTPTNNIEDSETEVGLNIGTGMEYALGFANLFAEVKYVLGDADQLNLGLGFRFIF